jgi:hypothetical protein
VLLSSTLQTHLLAQFDLCDQGVEPDVLELPVPGPETIRGLIWCCIGQRMEENILSIANGLKEKPKHKNCVHYGEEGYAKQEIALCELINFEIQIP